MVFIYNGDVRVVSRAVVSSDADARESAVRTVDRSPCEDIARDALHILKAAVQGLVMAAQVLLAEAEDTIRKLEKAGADEQEPTCRSYLIFGAATWIARVEEILASTSLCQWDFCLGLSVMHGG
jgi:hypothetical protein